MEKEVSELNNDIKVFCKENLIEYIRNDSITESCLSAKKLHLNTKGCANLANNLTRYIKNLNNAYIDSKSWKQVTDISHTGYVQISP